jgi:uncharacterized protein (TIGR01319 family)
MSKEAKYRLILATDCGSTTTKARIFRKLGEEFRFVCTGEAPTTVEAPFEDVTMGVRNAVREVEELMGIKALSDKGILIRQSPEDPGVDLYVTTSSAGGGLQMMVFGLTKSITGESCERAALGGGAIVMDIVSMEDGEPIYKKIERTRSLRPDMVLLSGGTDGGNVREPVQVAEILKVSDPKARFGAAFSLPVIYAGNKDAANAVQTTLENQFALKTVDNLRPTIELENTDPARDAIQELFMEHVMSHAPGYDKLMTWTQVPIMPTPRGEGTMFQTVARMRNVNVIGVGLGGATTNVYSVFDNKFVRTVSANLGMSYSICNVLRETGLDNILRWIPFEIDPTDLDDILANKMIRPTTIPHSLSELVIEHAVAREALRLGFDHHKFLARGLRGAIPAKLLSDTFGDLDILRSYIDLLRVDLIGGTGGLLSHAPRRIQSALMLMDGFQPEGITRLIQDSVFMFPHLGVLSSVEPDIAYEVFDKDAVIRLGTCIAPRGAPDNFGDAVMDVSWTMPNGEERSEHVVFGDIIRIPIPVGQVVEMTINPHRSLDMGEGSGRAVTAQVEGGEAGILLDGRGRPIRFSDDRPTMKQTLLKWFKTLDVYSPDALQQYEQEVL